jgi:hypothetical protein
MMFEQGAASDVARAVEDAKLALAAGFTLPETVVPFGTKVIDSGQGLYRESEQAFDAMENVDDVLDQLIARVAMEDRRDIKLDSLFRNFLLNRFISTLKRLLLKQSKLLASLSRLFSMVRSTRRRTSCSLCETLVACLPSTLCLQRTLFRTG